MEPRIQYARTSDGVSIAYWTMGQGMPLVYMPGGGGSHTQLELRDPDVRRWYERLAENQTLVRFDPRGFGLSQRKVDDFSLSASVRDLEAVVGELGLKRFALFGGWFMGPVAIAYTANHPDRVSHLLLWCTWARGSDFFDSPQVQTTMDLIGKDWELGIETVTHLRPGEGVLREAIGYHLGGDSTGEPAGRPVCGGATAGFA